MLPIMFCIVLAIASLVAFLFFLRLILSYYYWKNLYYHGTDREELLERVRRAYDKAREPIRKNLLLYWVICLYKDLGHEEKAKDLVSFLRKDLFFIQQ